MSLVLLAALTVLVVAYLLTPSIRDRFFFSPLSSVGHWKRGMSALSPEARRTQQGLAASAAHPALIPHGETPTGPRDPSGNQVKMRVHNGQREVLVPGRSLPSGAGLASATGGAAPPDEIDPLEHVPYTAPLEEHPSNPWDVVAVPHSPAQRRQAIQIVLGGFAGVFALAGFFVSVLWVVSLLFVLLLLGYLALAHEVRRRNYELDRARKMAQIRGETDPGAGPRPRTAKRSASRQVRTRDGRGTQPPEQRQRASARTSAQADSGARTAAQTSQRTSQRTLQRSSEPAPARSRATAGATRARGAASARAGSSRSRG